MKSFNRLATYLLIAGLFGLCACMFADRGHNDRRAPQAEAHGDHDNGKHNDGNRGCDSNHRGDGCQDAEHH